MKPFWHFCIFEQTVQYMVKVLLLDRSPIIFEQTASYMLQFLKIIFSILKMLLSIKPFDHFWTWVARSSFLLVKHKLFDIVVAPDICLSVILARVGLKCNTVGRF